MLINGLPKSTWGVFDYQYEFGEPNVTTYENWLRGAPSPVVYDQTVQYSSITIDAYMSAINRDTLENHISMITRECTKAVISFASVSGTFEGFLTSRSVEMLTATSARVTLSLQGRRLTDEVVEEITQISVPNYPTKIEALTIDTGATCDVPFTLTINTASAVVSLLMWVDEKIYYFDDLDASSTYVLDTEKGRFYKVEGEDEINAIEHYGSYTLPSLKAGDNTIKFSSSGGQIVLAGLKVSCKGRWM